MWVLGWDLGCELVRVFILHVGIEASEGCGMWVASEYFGVPIGSVVGGVHCMICVLCWFAGIRLASLFAVSLPSNLDF